jgi:hypothetical protein
LSSIIPKFYSFSKISKYGSFPQVSEGIGKKRKNIGIAAITSNTKFITYLYSIGLVRLKILTKFINICSSEIATAEILKY